MRSETAEVVLPVFRYGLLIKERLRHGEPCSMSEVQAKLKTLLRKTEQTAQAGGSDTSDVFLGIRYPLACWLDEIFIVDKDSPWKVEWNEQKLEWALFQTNERAWMFKRQARLAESRGDIDALEVFYLCVMLGFRGDWNEDLNGLLDWRDGVQNRIVQDHPSDWPDKLQELPVPETNAFPLVARDRLRLMMLTGAIVVGVAIEVAVWLVLKVMG